jgi:hypothetical protein
MRQPKTHCKYGHEYTPENTWTKPDGTGRACRACNRASQQKQRSNDPERLRANQRASYHRTPEEHRLAKQEWQNKKLYGIQSIAERDAILASQGNACALCGRVDCHWGKGFTDTWHTDHNHDLPGTHRGILCAFCNTALGRLEPIMPKVIEYLKYCATQNSVIPDANSEQRASRVEG